MSAREREPRERREREAKRPELMSEALVLAKTLDVQALLTKALETNAGIDTIERFVALAKDVRAVTAREAWFRSMAEFQRTCPPILKTKTAKIKTTRGEYEYDYAPLDEILRVVQPVMGPLGLSISWWTRTEGHHAIVARCRVAHELGHVEDSGDMVIPIAAGDEGRGANLAQRVASAMMYAKRYSLLAIVGLAPESDDDGRDAGDEPKGEWTDDAPGTTPATEPGPESDRPEVTAEIRKAADGHKLTKPEREELTTKYLHGAPMNKARIEDLRQLGLFLGDTEAVAQWRIERA